jgi:hypothetical protein
MLISIVYQYLLTWMENQVQRAVDDENIQTWGDSTKLL